LCNSWAAHVNWQLTWITGGTTGTGKGRILSDSETGAGFPQVQLHHSTSRGLKSLRVGNLTCIPRANEFLLSATL